jgi:hypothetical protein
VGLPTVPFYGSIGISPKRLPAGDPGATELRIHLEDKGITDTGAPAGVKETKIGLDRSIRFEPGTLPVCRWPGVESGIQIQSTGIGECPRAVVGRVEATVLFAYAENTPITIPVKGKIYNGGIRGGTIYLLVELPLGLNWGGTVPLVVPVRAVKAGRIGSEATIRLPRLGDGAGHWLNLDLELQRGLNQDGKSVGYVNADCRDGKLAATFAAVLADGNKFAGESIIACTSNRHRGRPARAVLDDGASGAL